MGFGEADLLEDDGRIGTGFAVGISAVSCSICFETVRNDGARSTAKLQCGHEFHLDCIGSAFNAKGAMQCPNCRKVEKGQWLYANGFRSYQEYNMDDWAHEEDLYDLNYSEMLRQPFGVHWCPFRGVSQVPPFEDRESQSISYHDLLGHHAVFTEHSATSLLAHSCPYFQPLQPFPSSTADNAESPTLRHNWSGRSIASDILASQLLSGADHYHVWDQQPLFPSTANQINSIDSSATVRSARIDSDGHPRTRSFMHPNILSHRSGIRAGSSVISSMAPPYPGNSQVRAYHHGHHVFRPPNTSNVRAHISNGIRRPGSRSLVPVSPASTLSDPTTRYMFPPPGSSSRSILEMDGSVGRHFFSRERDRDLGWWGSIASGSDSSTGTGAMWHRHPSDRPSSMSSWAESTSYQPAVLHPRTHQETIL